MARLKKRNAVEPARTVYGEHIYYVDLFFKKELIKPGTLMQIKNDRSIYIFESMQCNSKTGKEWVNFRSQTNGDWKSVYPDKIKCVVIKRSRSKNERTRITS